MFNNIQIYNNKNSGIFITINNNTKNNKYYGTLQIFGNSLSISGSGG
ncbi:MAG: hypothetical protein WCP92_03420 [bacterium]